MIRHVVVAHIDLLNVEVVLQGLANWIDLLVREDIFEQVQVSQRQNLEQLRQSFSTNFVVINIDVAKVLSVLKNLDQVHCSYIVNLIIR